MLKKTTSTSVAIVFLAVVLAAAGLREDSVVGVVVEAQVMNNTMSSGSSVTAAASSSASSPEVEEVEVSASVKLPITHQLSTCRIDDGSSTPKYQSHYELADGEANHVQFVVQPGTKGCLLIFSCQAVEEELVVENSEDGETVVVQQVVEAEGEEEEDDTYYYEDQVMTVRASVNAYLNATLYNEDGSVLVPNVSPDVIAATTVSSPSSLYVAFQDSGVSTTQDGRIALSLACVKVKLWIGSLPNASHTNILDDADQRSNVVTSSSSYKSWVFPSTANGGQYPSEDRKAYFISCPAYRSPSDSSSSSSSLPLLMQSQSTVKLLDLSGFTDLQPDELYVVNLDSSDAMVFHRLVSWRSSQNPYFALSAAGFYLVWGTGVDSVSSVAGVTLSYSCSASTWSFSGIGIEEVENDASDDWVGPTIVILLIVVILIIFLFAVVYYLCCRAPDVRPSSTLNSPVVVTTVGGTLEGLPKGMVPPHQLVMTSDAVGEALDHSTSSRESNTSKNNSPTHKPQEDGFEGVTPSATPRPRSSQTTAVRDGSGGTSNLQQHDAVPTNPLQSKPSSPSSKVIGVAKKKPPSQLRVQAALVGVVAPPLQYYPNKSSTRSPWKAAPSSSSGSSSGATAKPPPSAGDTIEYRSEIGDVQSSLDSGERGGFVPFRSDDDDPNDAPVKPSTRHRGSSVVKGGSSPRRGSPSRAGGFASPPLLHIQSNNHDSSPQQQPPIPEMIVDGFSPPPMHLAPLDAVETVDGGIVPYRPVSPSKRGSPLPGLAALGGGTFNAMTATNRFSAPWMKAFPPPLPKPDSPGDDWGDGPMDF